MNVILWSALISVGTLIVLLFNRSLPREIKIPSFFLGGRELQAPRRLTLTRPPWLLWLLVLLATVGGALAYWPPRNEGVSNGEARNAVLWVDDTFSATAARAMFKTSAEDIASDINRLGLNLFALEEKEEKGEHIRFVALQGELAIRRHLEAAFTRPASGLARPLAAEDLASQLAHDARFANGKSLLVVVSDGQRSSLRGLAPLKSSFQAVKLFAHREPETLEGTREDLVPGELLTAWGIAAPPEPFALLPLRDTRIPFHARPPLMRETFAGKGGVFRVTTRTRDAGGTFPLAIICAPALSGAQELDSFADLRSFAQFFSVGFRFENCSSSADSAIRNEREPWRFRRAALWIIPVNGEVAQSLLAGRLWTPSGFAEESDGLVYVAPSSGAENQLMVRPAPVPLDAQGAPVSLFLMPEPPNGLGFAPQLKAADGTPLGFRKANSAVFYLRTTLAMPNGELGRSGRWTAFWLDVARSMPQGGGMLRVMSAGDRREFDGQISRLGKGSWKDFSLWLDPASLELVPRLSEAPRVGLVVSPSAFEQILVAVPDEERSMDMVSVSEFEESWRDGTGLSDRERVERDRRFVPVAGALLGTMALAALWLFKGRLGALVPLLLLGIFTAPTEAQAQIPRGFSPPRFVPVNNIPFRVGWCAREIPTEIASRFRRLRDVLAERGTIRLPKEMVAGGCQAGLAELWWTDDGSLLSQDALAAHISGGGAFLWEGARPGELPPQLAALESPPIGMGWESPQKRGMLYRSFYLLQTFDGCTEDRTLLLRVRKKVNAQAPVGVVSGLRLLSAGADCFGTNEDYRMRSFVNLMYAFLTTDYKEDHMHLPELLSRVRNLGLEP